MRTSILSLASLSLLLAAGPAFSGGQNTHAGQAVDESVQASGHASASAAHSMAASGQVTSAASAVPLAIGGAVMQSGGAASTSAARELMNAASAPIGTPLQVTDDAIVTMPPNMALQKTDDKR